TASGNGTNYCSSACRPATTPTRTATPCGSICDLYFADTNISCNPDGSVHWEAIVQHNNSQCVIVTPYKVQLQVRHDYSGQWQTVVTRHYIGAFPPEQTEIQGDICYHF